MAFIEKHMLLFGICPEGFGMVIINEGVTR